MDCCWSIVLAVVAGLLTLYYYITRTSDRSSKHNIPTQSSLPFLGSMWKPLLGIKSNAENLQDMYNAFPTAKYSAMFGMMSTMIVIRDLDLMKSVAVKHFDHFPEHRSFVGDTNDPLFNKNLSALRGERWKEVRNLLSPAFTSSKMRAMFVLMSECAAEFSNALTSLPTGDRVVDLKDAFTRYTNDVIATCAFGISVNSMKDRENPFYMFGKKATGIQSFKFVLFQTVPGLMKRLGINFIADDTAAFFTNLVADTIKMREEKGIVRPDMIQLMMESREKNELSIEDMTAQAFIFFFGGFETSSVLMCFAAHEIGVNPDVQERLHQEIDKVLEENNGQLTYESVNNMPYLDAVINEALRMYPVAIATDRVCVKDFELPPAMPDLKPYVVKKGEMLIFPTYGFQHDPNYFDEPERFNPERFMEDGKGIASSGAYIPFGLGPRMCIGNRFALLETKTLLFHILARYHLVPCGKTPIPLRLKKSGFTMTAENGFWMEIRSRRNCHPSLVATGSSGGVDQ